MSLSTHQQNLAKIAVAIGVNLQPGQKLVINAPAECAEFARAIAKAAFERGAGDVSVKYSDEHVARLRYDHASTETLTKVPAWHIDRLKSMVDDGDAVISIHAEDPDVMSGVDAEKVKAAAVALNKAAMPYHDAIINNRIRWCVSAVPTVGWAKKVFPDLPDADAVSALWDAIIKASRVEGDDPIANWQAHNDSFNAKSDFLNSHQFKAFHYQSKNGTDLEVGMPEGYIFTGGAEAAEDGVIFFPNIPTEEVFSAPHKDKVNGTLVSSHPLVYNGQLIDGFRFTFKDGHVTDFHADVGEEALKSLVNATEGSDQLGEIALVPYHSPISEMNILFYNTLFDENASCHFALGSAYPTCIEGGTNMNEEQLKNTGLNVSATHVDFMVGTDDLRITGIMADGTKIPVFENGDWAI